MKTRMGWHFIGDEFSFGDGRRPRRGCWYKGRTRGGHPWPKGHLPHLCHEGMHAGRSVAEAAEYGGIFGLPRLCRVEVRGPFADGSDKFAGVARKIVWAVPAFQTRAFMLALCRWWEANRKKWRGAPARCATHVDTLFFAATGAHAPKQARAALTRAVIRIAKKYAKLEDKQARKAGEL